MRLLQVTASYKPAYVYGGPIVSVGALCEALSAEEVGVSVLTTTANGTGELNVLTGRPVRVDGVEVRYFRRLTGDPVHFSPSLLLYLWKTVKAVDLVHVHAWWNAVSVLGALLAVLRGKPVVLSPRGTLSPYSFGNRSAFSKRLIQVLIGRWVLRRCVLHATSRAEADELVRFVGSRPIVVIPNIVHLPGAVEPDPLRGLGPIRIGFLSRIEEKKGLEILFQAVAMLEIPYSLHVAGSGDPAYITRLKDLAADLGIKPVFMGYQAAEEKFSVLAGFDLLVLPSRNENFANVVIESLGTGTPVIVSDEVGLSDYVRDSGFGWTCPVDAKALADCITRAAADDSGRRFIRQQAPGKVRRDFDPKILAEAYLRFYQQLTP